MAASIGLNIVRYPVVWEMVGASSHFSQAGPAVQSVAAAQSEPASDSAAALKAESAADVSADQEPKATEEKPKNAERSLAAPSASHAGANKKPAGGGASARQENAADHTAKVSGEHEPGRTARAAKPKGKKAAPPAREKTTPATPAALAREHKLQQTAAEEGSPEKRATETATQSGRGEWPADEAAAAAFAPDGAQPEPPATPPTGGRLVPVVYPGAQSEAAPDSELLNGVCRLPSVDQVAPTPPDHLPPSAPGGPAPIYPSTGI
jgi:hypothetical protein